jgi:hypothetical protein
MRRREDGNHTLAALKTIQAAAQKISNYGTIPSCGLLAPHADDSEPRSFVARCSERIAAEPCA